MAKREFTHPVTGETMTLVEAIKRGYIQGTGDEIKRAITNHYEKQQKLNRAIMEYSTTKV